MNLSLPLPFPLMAGLSETAAALESGGGHQVFFVSPAVHCSGFQLCASRATILSSGTRNVSRLPLVARAGRDTIHSVNELPHFFSDRMSVRRTASFPTTSASK